MKTSVQAVVVVTFILVTFAFQPMSEAVVPPPDGGYPGGNTAEGQAALLTLTSGTHNTGVGLFSLRNNTTANFTQATTETIPTGTVWAYVDGSPYVGDVQIPKTDGTMEWKTYVFGALGRGGGAVYALDATDTELVKTAENNPDTSFKWQFTSNDDADLGYLVNDNPINANSNQPNPIAKLNNGEFALILTHPKLRGATGAWTSPIALV